MEEEQEVGEILELESFAKRLAHTLQCCKYSDPLGLFSLYTKLQQTENVYV